MLEHVANVMIDRIVSLTREAERSAAEIKKQAEYHSGLQRQVDKLRADLANQEANVRYLLRLLTGNAELNDRSDLPMELNMTLGTCLPNGQEKLDFEMLHELRVSNGRNRLARLDRTKEERAIASARAGGARNVSEPEQI